MLTNLPVLRETDSEQPPPETSRLLTDLSFQTYPRGVGILGENSFIGG